MSKLFHNYFYAEVIFLNHIIVIVTICSCYLLSHNCKQKIWKPQKHYKILNCVYIIEEIFFLNCMLWFLQMLEHRVSHPVRVHVWRKILREMSSMDDLLRSTLYWRNKWKFQLKNILCYIVHRLTLNYLDNIQVLIHHQLLKSIEGSKTEEIF